MIRINHFAALALLVGAGAFQARAAAPALPPDVVSADTVAVIHLDADHFNPTLVQSAATAILGNNANKVDDSLKKFSEHFDKISTAGAKAMTMVMEAPKKSETPAEDAPPREEQVGIMYIELKAGADVKAIESMLTAEMPSQRKANTVFEQADNFLAVHQKGQTFPVKPDAARGALFADALGTISDASIEVAFIPDAATRDKMIKDAANAPSKPLQDAAPLIANSKWITLAVNLGNAPSLTGTANAASDADAKSLTDDLNSAVADLKAQVANPGPNSNPMLAMAGPIVGPLLDGLKPTQTGTQVSVSIKTQALKTIANFAANFGLLGPGPGAGAGRPAPQ